MMPDVVIIGAGIIGSSCAYYLAGKGIKVHLLDRGAIGSGASKAGMCHIVTWEEPEIHLQLSLASKALYARLREELPVDIEYSPTGSLALVDSEESMQGMRDLVARLRSRGHPCEILTPADMRDAEPALTQDIAGGAFFRDDVQVNPLKATLGLALAAKRQGAAVEPYSEVVAIERDGSGRVQAVVTHKERIPTGCVINTAGAWSAGVGEMVGLKIPITPRKGHLALTAPLPQSFLHCKTMFSAGYLAAVTGGSGLAVACNIQQTQNGNLLLGSSRQFSGFDLQVDPMVLSEILKQSIRYFPALRKASIIRTWAGLRPYTPDILPVIGQTASVPGFFIASGHEGLGITEGPVTGKLISQLVCGEEPDIPLDLLSFERFETDRKPGEHLNE